MANPKRRHSHARSAKRRTHYKVESPNYQSCPNCGHPKLPHHVCPNCGYYKEKPVITPKEV
ncbi:MAG: 50S ribosomal protein L32 [Candidatus Marinimicrobia bacterium]|nr:50S ribosomal protein L32 [Candidatus Neomarinimicrobiota bacterium]MDD5582630.1 50S ribosomal protein L32 [Candidatus Neomarinimicrobiota bacterium]